MFRGRVQTLKQVYRLGHGPNVELPPVLNSLVLLVHHISGKVTTPRLLPLLLSPAAFRRAARCRMASNG